MFYVLSIIVVGNLQMSYAVYVLMFYVFSTIEVGSLSNVNVVYILRSNVLML